MALRRAVVFSFLTLALAGLFHNCAPIGGGQSDAPSSKGNLTYPQLYLSVAPGSSAQVPEGGVTVLRAELQSIQGSEVAVLVEMTGGTATSNVDVKLPISRVVIPAGANYTDFALEAMADATTEATESVSVKLKYENDPQQSSPVVISVIDGTPLPRLNFSSFSVKEGATANLVVTTALAAQSDITFNVISKAGTATSGTDYAAVNRVGVKIPRGQTPVSVPVTAIKDTIDDPNETFTLEIVGVVGALTPVAKAVVTITDGLPTVRISSPTAVEGNVLKFNITLTSPPKVPVTLTYETFNGTAVAGTHYVRAVGTLTFGVGVTTGFINIPSIEVRNSTVTRKFTTRLSAITNAENTTVTGTGTIVDSGR